MARRRDKVFGIGFHKTGTSSLKRALRHLGYRVTGPNGNHDADIAGKFQSLAADLSRRYDAFQDNPWPLVFREMDAMWPEARFVLTVRESDGWLKSQLRHFGTDTTPMRELIYGAARGSPVGNEAHYVAVMEAHNAAVRAHFADRPGKLLEMRIAEGDGWDPLCAFLGAAVPDIPFPHANEALTQEGRGSSGLGRLLRGFGRRSG
ncbi:MAG: sulfotransferase family protein [Paracoccaceae bacterium]